MSDAASNPVRDSALSILRALELAASDEIEMRNQIRVAASKLASVPGLRDLGVKREANHVPASYYLYYDSEMKITLDYLAKGVALKPHNHGAWEAFTVYSGRLHHTVYEAVGEQTEPGRAELRVHDDRILSTGDYALVAPPADIHGFTGLEDGTCLLTVALGHYSPARRYFDPARGTYEVLPTRNTR